MKITIRVIIVCVCIFAAHVIDRVTNHAFEPVAARLRIPAPPFTLNEVIHGASHKYQVPAAFIKSIIAAESAFSPDVVSPRGAVGLMQLMPETARELGADPAIPEQNVDAGTHYLSRLLHRYANKKNQLRDTIAAYNAGPGAVQRYKGVPPYKETRAYVTRVTHFFAKYQQEESGFSGPSPRYILASATTAGNAGHWHPRRGRGRTRAVAS